MEVDRSIRTHFDFLKKLAKFAVMPYFINNFGKI